MSRQFEVHILDAKYCIMNRKIRSTQLPLPTVVTRWVMWKGQGSKLDFEAIKGKALKRNKKEAVLSITVEVALQSSKEYHELKRNRRNRRCIDEVRWIAQENECKLNYCFNRNFELIWLNFDLHFNWNCLYNVKQRCCMN